MNETNTALNETEKTPTWSKTKNGLRQYLRKGDNCKVWYLNCRVGSHVLTESTGVTSHTLALQFKVKKLNEVLQQSGPVAIGKTDKLTLGDCVAILKHRLEADSTDPKTKLVRGQRLDTFLATWGETPELEKYNVDDFVNCLPKQIALDHILYWKKHYLKDGKEPGVGYAEDTFNKTLSLVREVFEIAIERNQILKNPATKVDRAKNKTPEKIIPTTDELKKIFSSPTLTPECLDFLHGLAYAGLRKEEANLLRVRHVDLENKVLNLPADICKGGTHGRSVPIFDLVLPLFTRLVEKANGNRDARVFGILDAKKGLARAAKWAGYSKPISHHTLRHYFATRALESTKDVQVVADWLGHLDRGALVLKTYAHVCCQFSNEARGRVSFEKSDKKAGLTIPRDTKIEDAAKSLLAHYTPSQLLKLSRLLNAGAESEKSLAA